MTFIYINSCYRQRATKKRLRFCFPLYIQTDIHCDQDTLHRLHTHTHTVIGRMKIRGSIQTLPNWAITKYMLTTTNTCWEAIQKVTAAKLTRLTHKIAIQLHLVAESCTICSSHSKRPVRKLLDTPSYFARSLPLSLALRTTQSIACREPIPLW
jgi:hypothetical protein